MDITFVANTGAIGGAEHYILTLLRGLREHRCSVLMPSGPAADEFRGRAGGETPVHDLETDGYSVHPRSLVRSMRFYRKLDSQVVHFNLANPCCSTVDILACRILGRSKIVVTTHLPTVAETRREKASSRIALRCADRVITVCRSGRQHLIGQGAPVSKVVSIYNGVADWHTPSERIASIRSELGVGASDILIGTVARLEAQKGLNLLLEAFREVVAQVPSVVLGIVGEGSLRSDLEKSAAALGISERVRFCGWRPDCLDIMRSLDIFVLPSLFESFPFTVVQAMMAGVPVVASDVGGVAEAVLDGQTGILVRPGIVEDLSAAIARFAVSIGLRDKMGRQGRSIALERFSSEAMVSRTRRVYEDLLMSNAPYPAM